VIRFQGVTKLYTGVDALRGLDLTVRSGEVYGLLGPNGAGKTTAMRLAVGLLEPSGGSVAIGGHDLRAEPREAKRIMGYVPDRPFLYEKLTGREYLEFVGGLWDMGPAACREASAPLLERFRLADAADRMIEGYSHGMKQKLALTAALMHAPRALVVDEPMVGLDPRAARELRALFREHARLGGSILVSTHQLEVAQAMCDRIGILNEGRLLAEGTLAELQGQAAVPGSTLERIFLALTEPEEDAGEDAP
jgi:ABC-2 type transport system ATP-binding protein